MKNMKIILVCQKGEFDQKRLKQLKKSTNVIWFDSELTDLHKITELFNEEEKILALSPVPVEWKFSSDLYVRMKNVKYLCLVTTSYELLDLDKCRANNIIVTNIPHYSTEAVAEQAIMMLMALSKKVPEQIKSGYKYDFSPKITGDDLCGKKVGIIGLGDIGMREAELVSALGMKVSYWSRNPKNVPWQYENIKELINSSDVVIPAVVSNEETFGFLNKDVLKLIKNNAYFVGLIDDRVWDKKYLLQRTKEGTLAGLAYESEKESLLNYKGNVFILPPFAWYSKQSLDNNIQIWAETILSCLTGKPQNRIA